MRRDSRAKGPIIRFQEAVKPGLYLPQDATNMRMDALVELMGAVYDGIPTPEQEKTMRRISREVGRLRTRVYTDGEERAFVEGFDLAAELLIVELDRHRADMRNRAYALHQPEIEKKNKWVADKLATIQEKIVNAPKDGWKHNSYIKEAIKGSKKPKAWQEALRIETVAWLRESGMPHLIHGE